MEAHGAAGPTTRDTPELEAVVHARRRFVVPALAFCAVVYGAFLICVGYARGFMATTVFGAFTWAYVWALALIVLTWAVTWSYLRYSERVLVPLTERARAASRRGAGQERT